MTIGERLREVRKNLKLTQVDFGNKIAVSQGHLTAMEHGKREVTDRTIKLVTQEFDISERWLRTGEGAMMAADAEDSQLVAWAKSLARDGDTFPTRLARALSKLTPAQWEDIERVFDQIMEGQPTPSPDAEAHALLQQELDAQREARSASPSTASERRA